MKWREWSRENESNIAFTLFTIFFVALIIYYCYDLICSRSSSIRLGVLSFPPLCFLAYSAVRTRSKALWLSLFWSILVIGIFLCFVYLECSLKFRSIHILLLSVLYGMIAVNSCFIGLGMPNKSFSPEQFAVLKNVSVFVSIAIVLYIFLLERIVAGERMLSLNVFLLSFIFLAIAVSFLYVILGYSSRNRNRSYNPLLFLICVTLCFSIGTTLSIFVLEYGRVLPGETQAQILVSRWTFLCVWTIFMDSAPLYTSERSVGLSRAIDWIIRKLVDNREFE